MAINTIQRTLANGVQTQFAIPFPYLDRAHVNVTVDGAEAVVDDDYTWVSSSTVQFVVAPADGVVVERRRVTPTGPLTIFIPGNLNTDDLNAAALQPLYVAEEAYNLAADAIARAPLLAAGSGAGPLVMPEPVNGRILGFAEGDLATFVPTDLPTVAYPGLPDRYLRSDAVGDLQPLGATQSARIDALVASAASGRDYLKAPARVDDYAALKALSDPLDTLAHVLAEGKAGPFVKRTGDGSALITSDPGEIDYVPITGVPTTTAIWSRPYDTTLPVWHRGVLGVENGGSAIDEDAAIQELVAFAKGFRRELVFGARTYGIKTTLQIDGEALRIRGMGSQNTGYGQGGTVIRALAAMGDMVLLTVDGSGNRPRGSLVEHILWDGNGLANHGIRQATSSPKPTIQHNTVRGTLLHGGLLGSFSARCLYNDWLSNSGHGLTLKRGDPAQSELNDILVIGNRSQGNGKHNYFLDTDGAKSNGILFVGCNSENGALVGTSSDRYAGLKIGGSTSGFRAIGMYIEQSDARADNVYQFGVDITAGASVDLDFQFIGSSGANPVQSLVRIGTSAKAKLTGVYSGMSVGFMDNQLSSAGYADLTGMREDGVAGYQAKLVDYSGAPTTAGTKLDGQPNQMQVSATMSSGMSVTTSAADIVWNTAVANPAGLLNTTTGYITVKEEGDYELTIRVALSAYTAAANEQLRLGLLNGASSIKQARFKMDNGSGSDSPGFEVTWALKCLSGDVLKTQISAALAGMTVNNTASFTYLNFRKKAGQIHN